MHRYSSLGFQLFFLHELHVLLLGRLRNPRLYSWSWYAKKISWVFLILFFCFFSSFASWKLEIPFAVRDNLLAVYTINSHTYVVLVGTYCSIFLRSQFDLYAPSIRYVPIAAYQLGQVESTRYLNSIVEFKARFSCPSSFGGGPTCSSRNKCIQRIRLRDGSFVRSFKSLPFEYVATTCLSYYYIYVLCFGRILFSSYTFL